jgi:hypothetical protein
MRKHLLLAFLLTITSTAFAQSKFTEHLLSANGFRNPSIGLEYQYYKLSAHGGYYVTNFTSGVTTKFLKTGLTYWFLPVGKKEIPSSFYLGASYLRGINRDYENKNAFAVESGFRWYVWKGLNFRLGVIALTAQGQGIKVNPTPSISYSIKL